MQGDDAVIDTSTRAIVRLAQHLTSPIPLHQTIGSQWGAIVGRIAISLANQRDQYAEAFQQASAEKAILAIMVRKAIKQFEFYAEQHKAKGTEDADIKAKTNQDLADKMRRLVDRLAPLPKSE